MNGTKKFFKSDKIKHLAIPQYKDLSVKEMKVFIMTNQAVLQYLPIEKEWEKLPKQFITNLVYTCTGEKFAQWVKERITLRNTNLVAKQRLAIDMDPDVMRAFMASTAVSSKCSIS